MFVWRKKPKIEILVVPLAILAFSLAVQAGEQCSAIFVNSEPGSLEWIHARNHEVNEAVRESKNSLAIKDWLKKAYFGKPIVRKSVPVNGRSFWQLVDYGLDKPVMLVDTDGDVSRTIFSGASISKNKTVDFLNFVSSKDFKNVVMVFSKKGNIETYRLILLDVAGNKIIRDDLMTSNPNKIKWTSPSSFTYENDGGGHVWEVEYNFKTNELKKLPISESSEEKLSWKARWTGSGWELVSRRPARTLALPKNISVESVLGEINGHVVMQIKKPSGVMTLAKISTRLQSARVELKEISLKSRRYLMNAFILDNSIAAFTMRGADRWMELLNSTGGNNRSIRLPPGTNLRTVGWDRDGHRLSMTLDSIIRPSQEVFYDLDKNEWSEDSIESEIMTVDGKVYLTETVEVTSEDGTRFPMQVTRAKDLVPNGKNPVLIHVYGGGSTTTSGGFDPARAEFVKHGGILMTPILRGGDELGPGWKRQGIGAENKINTIQDLIASARWAAQEGWSSPKKIIATGESHGAVIVSSAGLMAPESFGLIVAISGPYDLLHKEELDKAVDGFKAQFGDANVPEDKEKLEKVSPVELAKTPAQYPEFLIITGDTDSRVNKTHSAELTEVLRAHSLLPSNVFYLNIKNVGHQLQVMPGHGNQALRMNVVMWTTIYDYLRLKF